MNPQTLETNRLLIRSFEPEDLPLIHRILDQTFGDGNQVSDETALQERRSWLEWSILNQEWFPKLHEPPYGDRAVVLKGNNELIGSVGYVPLLDHFDQIPELSGSSKSGGFATPEFGLFWVIDPVHQGQGYATEAAKAMIDHAFKELKLRRVIATTTYSNLASQRVMMKAGMKIGRNPLPDSTWLQVVGFIENDY
jgi:ribosomal-protein-alanine N-acetyltransferase